MSKVAPFVFRKVIVLSEKSSLRQAGRAMAENGVGCIIVSDTHGHVSGIVTDRDIACRAVAQGLGTDMPISEIMTHDTVAAPESASLETIVDLMIENGVRRIPIVTHTHKTAQKCVGLVSLDDLIASQAAGPRVLARLLRRQLFQSARRRRRKKSLRSGVEAVRNLRSRRKRVERPKSKSRRRKAALEEASL